MNKTPWLFSSLAAMALAACGGNKGNANNSTSGGGTESGTMQGGATTTDTGMTARDTSAAGMRGMSSDTSAGAMSSDTSAGAMRSDTGTGGARMHSDTNQHTGASSRAGRHGHGNQTKSGVTDTKTGKSTLGPGATKTRPDQGQPVTSKGDTVAASPDSTAPKQ